MIQKIDILGQEYKLLKGNAKKYDSLNGADGFTDLYANKIVIDELLGTPEGGYKSENPTGVINRVYRHEVLHAFFKESGISYKFSNDDEEFLVDWIAVQFPKLKKVFEEMGVSE